MIHINNMVKGWRSDMKIVNVKVIKSNRAVYCKILTDEGITGLGESGAWGFLDTIIIGSNLGCFSINR